MGGLGSRTTTPQQIVYDALKAADTGDSKAFVALSELGARCVRAEEALREAERLITEHHKVGALDGYHIGDTCPVCAAFGTPLAAVPEENQGGVDKPA